MRFGWPPEPGFARREAKRESQKRSEEEGGTWGKHGFPHEAEPARRSRAAKAEKEGFEPSRQGFSPPNALAGRRLQPLGHFSGGAKGTARLFLLQSKSPFRGMAARHRRCMLKKPAPLEFPPGIRVARLCLCQAGFAVFRTLFRKD